MTGEAPRGEAHGTRRAVFLDRDGTLVKEVGYLHDPAEVELETDAAEAVRRLNRAGLPVVMVTNQSGIARGLFDERAMEAVHDALRTLLAREEARLDAVYACPHHPEGSVEAWRTACGCRKPGTGMLERAARELGLRLPGSYLIGDKGSDLQCARNGGLLGILVTTGYGQAAWAESLREEGAGREPDFVAGTLLEAAMRVLEEESGGGAGAGAGGGPPFPRAEPPWTCKFVSRDRLKERLARHRARGETVVLATGVFDLFHAGHAGYLQAARREGDVLVVGVNDDASARALKGPPRPVFPAQERISVVSALACVDYCVLVREREADALVEAVRPDVHARGTGGAEAAAEKEPVGRVGGRVRIVGPPKRRSGSDTIRAVAGRDET